MALINFSGLASGIDSNALIDAMIDAQRKARIVPQEQKITQLEDTNTALDELKTKVLALNTAASKFTTLSGGGISKLGASSDESKVAASASNSASNGTYTVTVSTLAKNATGSFNYPYTSGSDSISAAGGDVDVTIGSGTTAESFTITVGAGMTASEFVTEFNEQTDKAVATLVKIADGDYRIVISTNQQGTAEGSLTITSAIVDFADTEFSLEDATDAAFSISGIADPITRSTNTISDVIPGVTFNLLEIGTATITISTDVATTAGTVEDLVDAYNAVVKLMSEKNLIERDESSTELKNIFGPLSTTRVDENFLTAIRNALSATNYSSGTEIRIFADLGITTERDGTLKFSQDTFEAALSKEPSSVDAILTSFADTVATTAGTIAQFTRFNGLFDLTTRSNQNSVEELKKRIVEAEAQLARQRENLMARFARLESLMGKLQGQQSALTNALAGLTGGR